MVHTHIFCAPILRQPRNNELPLPLTQPLRTRLFGKIRQQKPKSDRAEGRKRALEYENPSPSAPSISSVQEPDSAGEEAGEGTCELDGRVEEGEAFLGFRTPIPGPDEVETPAERTRFADAEEETGCQEAGVGVYEALEEGNEAEEEGAKGDWEVMSALDVPDTKLD